MHIVARVNRQHQYQSLSRRPSTHVHFGAPNEEEHSDVDDFDRSQSFKTRLRGWWPWTIGGDAGDDVEAPIERHASGTFRVSQRRGSHEDLANTSASSGSRGPLDANDGLVGRFVGSSSSNSAGGTAFSSSAGGQAFYSRNWGADVDEANGYGSRGSFGFTSTATMFRDGEAPFHLWPPEPQRWMPDEKVTVCFRCGLAFGFMRRRHHCRLCGQIFCHNCSRNFVDGQLIGREREVRSRLCEECTNYCDGLELHNARQAPAPFTAPRSPRVGLDVGSEPSASSGVRSRPLMSAESDGRPSRINSATSGGGKRMAVRFDDESISGDPPGGPDLLRHLRRHHLDDSSRRSFSDRGSDDSDYDHDFDDSDLGRGFAFSGDESDSPTQRVLSAHFDLQPDSQDCEALNDDCAAWYRNDSRRSSRRDTLVRQDADTQRLAELSYDMEGMPTSMAAEGEVVAEHADEWRAITSMAIRHFTQSVSGCCIKTAGGLEDPTHIYSICGLAQQVVEHYEPCRGDSMDILSYVKAKRIPGGHISDSQWVNGVVFSRDISHKKMRTNIVGGHVALLREPLSFDQAHRLTRMDDLRRQEEDNYHIKVQKIADLQPQPDLLLCQGGVSQLAQIELFAKNISLIIGVPAHILEAVARCTGAKVLQSVDSIQRCTAGGKTSVVGAFRCFNVQRTGQVGDADSKALAVLEGNHPDRYNTVCLRGGGLRPAEEALAMLTDTKCVLQWAIRLARHLQLESELLFEMWCDPWPRTDLARACPSSDTGGNPRGWEDIEHFDLVCYSVSEQNKRCTRPIQMRLPAYVTPPMPARNHVRGASQVSGWAGGLEAGVHDGVRDCTLMDWLMRCFVPEAVEKRPAVILPEATRSTPLFGEEARTALEDSAMDSNPGSFVPEGVELPGGTSVAHFAAASALDPPVPGKGEILCFQHRGSSVFVQLHEPDEVRIAKSRSNAAALTRWALLGHESGRACGRASSTSSEHQASGPSSSIEIEMWRVCRECGRPVMPRTSLSPSAGWHSFAKFLELILHNDTSLTSPSVVPAANSGETPCPHVAFRNHHLFFGSPQRPLIVAFWWEPITTWKLHPPHLPLWDPTTYRLCNDVRLADQEGSSLPSATPTSTEEDCQRLLAQLQDVVTHVGVLIKCVLLALSTSDDIGKDAVVAAAVARNICRSRWQKQLARQNRASFADLQNLQPTWLKEWVWGNKHQWHRILRDLDGLHARLTQRMQEAEERLTVRSADGKDGGKPDSIVLAFVQRDLLDVLGFVQPAPLGAASKSDLSNFHLAHAEPCSSVRGMNVELQGLWKLKHAPSDCFLAQSSKESSKEESDQPNRAGSGVAGSLNILFPAVLKRLWPQDEETEEKAEDDTAAEVPRARSRSLCRDNTVRGHFRRSNSSGYFRPEPEDYTWRRTCSYDSNLAELHKQEQELWSLPKQVRETLDASERCRKEGNCRIASLERGVLGLTIPVHEEDVGSLIAYALLSTACDEQMAEQWDMLAGGQRCCPLSQVVTDTMGQNRQSCFASLPAALRQPVKKSHQRFKSAPVHVMSHNVSGPAGHPMDKPPAEGARLAEHQKLASLPWKDLPANERGQPQQRWEMDMACRGMRQVLTGPLPPEPVRVDFSDQEAKYSVAIHHAAQYHILRHWLCGDDLNFARSLQRCTRIALSGGKSGAAFFVSHDRRFLLKAVVGRELRMLTTQPEALFWYADKVLFDKLPSVLTQVVGLFTVSVTRHKKTKGTKRSFVVQRNLRYSLQNWHHYCFDLKGVGRSRRVSESAPPPKGGGDASAATDGAAASASSAGAGGSAGTGGQDGTEEGAASTAAAAAAAAGDASEATKVGASGRPGDGAEQASPGRADSSVLWDQNFREWTKGNPLCLEAKDLMYLEAAVWNDTQLCAKQSLMDYSLLVAAVQPDPPAAGSEAGDCGILSLGIIDYLRPYTWDKLLEHKIKNVKHNLQQTAGQPTIIEPVDYARRLRHAISTYFAASPPQAPAAATW